MQAVGVMRINIQGKALLADGTNHIIIANHPTLIDVILIVAQMKEVDCAVKQEHWKNPFVSGVIKATGYISNSSPEQLLEECVNNINDNRSLIIFPEGTRTTPGEKIRFKRGAAHLAIRCNKNLKPIIISCSPLSLTKGEKWYQVPKEGPMNISLTIKEIIQTESCKAQTKNEPIAARQLTQHLEEYYQKEVLTNDRFSHRN
ncbi:FIG018329: 1-acyl-sn-glycerol-3-phosphate acyltransferase [hydrothermal vent metagenome]|uniref:FIG018329: 1-acyl-sn-glycerol-3-phosphate acyltransferase n=1 Tax=hydrothermal vent metagenome TaxID=652676 RepID=A0A3B0X1C8_9ZZZZ